MFHSLREHDHSACASSAGSFSFSGSFGFGLGLGVSGGLRGLQLLGFGFHGFDASCGVRAGFHGLQRAFGPSRPLNFCQSPVIFSSLSTGSDG